MKKSGASASLLSPTPVPRMPSVTERSDSVGSGGVRYLVCIFVAICCTFICKLFLLWQIRFLMHLNCQYVYYVSIKGI